MKQSLQFKLSQQLTLTPQLRQSIRLLQLSTQELDQEIETYLRDNPLLEREDGSSDSAQVAVARDSVHTVSPTQDTGSPDGVAPDSLDAGESANQFDLNDFRAPASVSSRMDDDDDGGWPDQPSEAPTLREHLLAQIALLKLSDRDRVLAGLLVESLDEDGYLTQSLEELLTFLPAELEIEAEELAAALHHVQHMEPAGVGARNVGECLSLQLRAMPLSTPYRERALQIVNQHLDALASRDYTRLKRELKCDDNSLRAAQSLITGLNPKLGRDFGQDDVRYVIPDVNVQKIKGLWVATLNSEAMPKLREIGRAHV